MWCQNYLVGKHLQSSSRGSDPRRVTGNIHHSPVPHICHRAAQLPLANSTHFWPDHGSRTMHRPPHVSVDTTKKPKERPRGLQPQKNW
ncbi:hypothetical protein GDO81_014650 [Engystomops pustulosus]|uniref:Uncharacterized protein n=1 Tax=Engystomops pustulosus TaxID=76066 RepID=A0AAV7BC47_ENGPU|nr:hypothetical protein GDO81_014650 [Engystomops pustulosus]